MMPIIVEQVLWTETAKKSFAKIIDWLEKNWTIKEIDNFIHNNRRKDYNFKTISRKLPTIIKTKKCTYWNT